MRLWLVIREDRRDPDGGLPMRYGSTYLQSTSTIPLRSTDSLPQKTETNSASKNSDAMGAPIIVLVCFFANANKPAGYYGNLPPGGLIVWFWACSTI